MASRMIAAGATLLCALLLSAATPRPGVAQRPRAILSLVVTDEKSDRPVAGVGVSMVGSGGEWATDSTGHFAIAAAPGRLVLMLRRDGYEPGTLTVDLAPNDTARLVYYLSPAAPAPSADAQALAGVTVTAKADPHRASLAGGLAGFEARLRNHAGGTFITREEIERRKPVRVTDLLRGVLGVQVIDSMGVKIVISRRGAKPQFAAAPTMRYGRPADDRFAPCVLRVAVDGVLMAQGYPLDDLEQKEIHGIEVYAGPASIPAEFGGARKDAWCGMLMVWTRIDR